MQYRKRLMSPPTKLTKQGSPDYTTFYLPWSGESLLVERLLPFQSHIDSWTILITYLFSGKDSIKSIRTLVLLPVFSIIVHSCLYLSVEITILAFPLRCLPLSILHSLLAGARPPLLDVFGWKVLDRSVARKLGNERPFPWGLAPL